MVFGGEFCRHQAEWFTGTACSTLGIISTLGSQMSLFSMTALSMIRGYGIIRGSLIKSSEVNKKAIAKTILIIIGVVSAALAIAIIPLMASLEDYFVQGMYYDPSNKMFIGFPNKERHINILQTYFNNTINQKNISRNITAEITWKEVGQKVDSMFSQQNETIKRSAVHFYGNDGVCLFKYFVRSDDARRSREGTLPDIKDKKGDVIVWLMLGVNLACFILIAICYVMMNVTVRRSSKKSGSNQTPSKKRESRHMQKKITFIIATDFLCWVPFIIISAFHNLAWIDATDWYLPFTMTVLPLNSVINPMIYDKKLEGHITVKMQLLVDLFNSTRVVVRIREGWQTRRASRVSRATDNMEMGRQQELRPDEVIAPAP